VSSWSNSLRCLRPSYSKATRPLSWALSRVLRAAAIQLQTEFAIDGRVDHTYIGGAARAALADAGLPTDLALRTGLSLRHILVDEFPGHVGWRNLTWSRR